MTVVDDGTQGDSVLALFGRQSVMNGFVNGFAIVIFVSQLKLCINQSIEMYILLAAGIAEVIVVVAVNV